MTAIDSLSTAYQTARNLAGVIDALGRRLPLSQPTAFAVRSDVYLVSGILAPRLSSAGDVALIGSTLIGAAAAISAEVEPQAAAPAFADAAAGAASSAPVYSSPALTRAGALGRMLAACAEAALLGFSFVAEAKTDFGDQQSAIAARQRISAALDGAIDRIAAASSREVVDLLNAVARQATGHIAAIAADLRPVVRVSTLRSAPSTALAFDLYGDPARAVELVARNNCGTPLFMPTTIEALAPDA